MSRNYRSRIIILLVLLFSAERVLSETADIDRAIVVSASKTPTRDSWVGSAVTVLTQKDLERSQVQTVGEALRDVPGVDVVASGPLGGNVAVFLRGANSEHTLVILDGVEINNPSSNARFFNFANLLVANIERIEILRGAQSSLYGSDAIGGVITIRTKQGRGPWKMHAQTEGGSYATSRSSLGLSGSSETVAASLSVSHERTDGFSAAGKEFGNSEDDGYENTTYSSMLTLAPFEEGQIDLSYRHIEGIAEIDNFGGFGGDDPNRELVSVDDFFRVGARWSVASRVSQRMGVGVNWQRFRDDNDPDTVHPGEMQRSRYRGRLSKWDFSNTLDVGEQSHLTVGTEIEREDAGSSYASEGPFGPFAESFDPRQAVSWGIFGDSLAVMNDRAAVTTGVRLDDHKEFGSEVTFRLAPVYHFPESGTRVSSSLGTGFKAPSLYQLYSSYGNVDLTEEKSVSVDAGISQEVIGDKLVIHVRYFHSEIENLISFNSQSFLFENTNQATMNGLELSVDGRVTHALRLSGSYTFLRALDDDTDQQLLRRAKNKGSVKLDWMDDAERLSIGARVRAVGKRYDNDFSTNKSERVSLGGYAVTDLMLSYKIANFISLFGRVENIFDRDYAEVFGYGTAGVTAFAGAEFTL